MRDLRKDDRLKLMSFNTWMTRTVDFTTDVAQVEKALRAVTAGGGTALFDALSVALTSATDPDRRQLVVFFTDGSDSSSTTSRELLPQIVDRTRATVSFVVLPSASNFCRCRHLPPASMTSRMQIDPAIQRVATESGGSVMLAAGDLGLAFLRALDAFRSAYVLLYAPRGVERGGFHTIDVQVGRPDVVVLARRGYFGAEHRTLVAPDGETQGRRNLMRAVTGKWSDGYRPSRLVRTIAASRTSVPGCTRT